MKMTQNPGNVIQINNVSVETQQQKTVFLQ